MQKFISIFLFSLILFFTGLILYSVGPFWNLSSDSNAYLWQADCFANQSSIAGFYQCWNNSTKPIGTSLIFSILINISSENYFLLNGLISVSLILVSFFSFLWFRKNYQLNLALMGSLFLLASIFTFNESIRILSDILFFLFFAAAIYFSEGLVKNNKVSIRHVSLFLFTSFYATIIRSPGVCLFIAGIIFWLFQWKKFPFKILLLNVGVILILLGLSSFINMKTNNFHVEYLVAKVPFSPDEGYLTINEYFQRFLFNVGAFGKNFLLILDNSWYGNIVQLKTLFYVPILLVVLISFVSNVIFKKSIAYFAGMLLFSIHILYPFPNIRYLFPILPIAVAAFYDGLHVLGRVRWVNNPMRYILLTILSAYLVSYLWMGQKHIIEEARNQHIANVSGSDVKWSNTSVQELADWLRLNTPKTTTYLTYHPYVMDWMTERHGIDFPLSKNDELFFQRVRAEKPEYVLADESRENVQWFLLPHIERNPEVYELVERRGRGKRMGSLYRINFEKIQ